MRIGTGDRYEIMRNGRFMRYHNITHGDMLNGDGLRVVLWVAGCEHACEECQNPITWSPEGGIEFDCEAMDEIETELKKPHIAGITFSGGDPLHPSNIEKVREISELVREKYSDKTIWLYTGYSWEDIEQGPEMFETAKLCDVIVDGRFDKTLKENKYHWAGSTNQRIIAVQRTLAEGKIVLHDDGGLKE